MDYCKIDSANANYQYIQSIDKYTKTANGSWDQGKHTEIGVNPVVNNTKVE